MIGFFIILVVIDIYAYRMVRQIDHLKRGVWVFWLLNGLLYAFMINVFLDWVVMDHVISIYLRAFIIIYFFSKFAFILPLVLDDFRRIIRWCVTRFRKPRTVHVTTKSRKQFLKNISIAMGAAPFMVMGYGVVRNIYRYRVLKQKIKVPNLHPDLEGLRIVQISDIHSGTFPEREPVLRGVEMINELQPDIFVFTGDLVNSTAGEIDPFIEYFSRIKARYGQFSIMGNHDYGDYHPWQSESEKVQNDKLFEQKHRELGWELLRNENRSLRIGQGILDIIGVENYSTLSHFPRVGDLQAARKGLGDADFRLLLSHDPTHWNAEVTTENQDIHLTLSGHTHGFQFGFEIPGVFRWSPAQYIYKEWAGLYQTKNQFLYVNRGYGVLGYPGRVGILPEITLIELEQA